MAPESFSTPAIAALILSLASLIIIPTVTMNNRGEASEPAASSSAEADGVSCALPPILDIQESGAGFSGEPLLENVSEEKKLETATFALG